MHPDFLLAVAKRAVAGAALLAITACSSGSITQVPPLPPQATLFKQKINHIIVIYQENWGFDSLYGNFPGANGFSSAVNFSNQVDLSGNTISALPPIYTSYPNVDTRFPATLPVATFDETAYIGGTAGTTGDPNHNYWMQQAQIDGGKMDKYLAYGGMYNGAGGLSFGYIDATNLPKASSRKITRSPITSRRARSADRSSTTSGWRVPARPRSIPPRHRRRSSPSMQTGLR